MKRIGVILESTNCSKFLHETIRNLASSADVELFFLINRSRITEGGLFESLKFKIRTRGVIRLLDLAFYQIMIKIEHKLVSRFSPSIREHHKTLNVDEFQQNEIIHLDPEFSRSRLIVRYPESNIASIRALDLDLIVRGNAPGIFKGDIVRASKEGILSFHHGDNRWNRGGPPGFWEVYLRKPSTGFVVQVLTEELDGGIILLRGEIQTQRTYSQNVDSIFSESNQYMAKVVLDYASSGRLPEPEEQTPFGGSLLMAPTVGQSTRYLAQTCMLLLSIAIKRLVLRKSMRWGVAYVAGSWRNATLRRGVRIENPAGHFYADPFVVERNNKTVCFLEDYSYKDNRARITAVEIIGKKKYKILGPALDEGIHMSFPYLFEYEDDLYMLPETGCANSIRIYRCIDFPLKWEFQEEIMSDVSAGDSMMFEKDGKWWLLTNLARQGGDDHDYQLMAYYSNRPVAGVWTPHERNPLTIDSTIGRNGGILDASSNFPIRCRQRQGFNSYGEALSLARITELTPSTFSEEEIGKVEPNFFPGIVGAHHLHSNGKYSVYDFVREETTG